VLKMRESRDLPLLVASRLRRGGSGQLGLKMIPPQPLVLIGYLEPTTDICGLGYSMHVAPNGWTALPFLPLGYQSTSSRPRQGSLVDFSFLVKPLASS
jgi:hypothetical protein